jgi:hypothetical protein
MTIRKRKHFPRDILTLRNFAWGYVNYGKNKKCNYCATASDLKSVAFYNNKVS